MYPFVDENDIADSGRSGEESKRSVGTPLLVSCHSSSPSNESSVIINAVEGPHTVCDAAKLT